MLQESATCRVQVGINSLVSEAETMPWAARREAVVGEPSPGSEGGHGIVHPQPTTHCPASPWGFGGTREWVSLGHLRQEPLQPALSGS